MQRHQLSILPLKNDRASDTVSSAAQHRKAKLGGLFLAGSLSLALAIPALTTAAPPSGNRSVAASGLNTAQFADGRPLSFADLVEKVKPAVVSVRTSATVRQPGFTSRSPNNGQSRQFGNMEDFFQEFFGRRGVPGNPAQRKTQGLGSGFIISASGHAVTNHHVIENADDIVLVLDDGRELKAELIGSDAKTDLALLKVESKTALPFVSFGNSDSARVGDWVVAIGNPFGLGGTATTGIISARGRDIQAGPFDDFIQIDAPINSGNSGGPLFNLRGEVVGINTAIYSPNGGNVGIGFAVPSEQAQPILTQLQTAGHVQRGWLGVAIQDIDANLATSLELKSSEGALVASVMEDSPAENAGLQPGDVILKFADQTIENVKDLTRAVAAAEPNSKQVLRVWRDGKNKRLNVTLKSQQQSELLADNSSPKAEKSIGVALAALDANTRQQLRLDDKVTGAVITQVQPASPAAESGLRRGDVVTAVNRKAVKGPRDAAKLIGKSKDVVLLLIQRQGRERFIAVEVG